MRGQTKNSTRVLVKLLSGLNPANVIKLYWSRSFECV